MGGNGHIMNLGCLFTYRRRTYAFTQADQDGETVFATEFLRAVLKYAECERIDIFGDTYRSIRRTVADGEWDDLRLAFPATPIGIRKAQELPELVRSAPYLFKLNSIELQPLAETRLATGVHFPLSTTLGSLDAPFLLPLYMSLLLLCRRYDAVVVPSCAGYKTFQELIGVATESLSELGGTAPARKFYVETIPHGVDEHWFADVDRLAARRLLSIPQKSRVLLYVGRLSAQVKADLEPLLIAFDSIRRSHPAAHLVIAGHDVDGTYSQILRKRIADMNMRQAATIIVDFPHCLKPHLYRAADVFVSPVDNIQETFGMSLIEAMASSCPVVASDWSGYRDIVEHGVTGFLVPTAWSETRAAGISEVVALINPNVRREMLAETTVVDVGSLIRHLELLVKNDDLCRSMGRAGRRRAEESFTWSIVMDKYKTLWAEQLRTMQAEMACPPRPLHDLNRLFSHYASSLLRDETQVRTTARAIERAEYTESTCSPTAYNARASQLKDIVAAGLGRTWELGALAREYSVSRSQIARWVKKGLMEIA
jgi:glycosyltransferase involved in cell wall biosynthesis